MLSDIWDVHYQRFKCPPVTAECRKTTRPVKLCDLKIMTEVITLANSTSIYWRSPLFLQGESHQTLSFTKSCIKSFSAWRRTLCAKAEASSYVTARSTSRLCRTARTRQKALEASSGSVDNGSFRMLYLRILTYPVFSATATHDQPAARTAAAQKTAIWHAVWSTRAEPRHKRRKRFYTLVICLKASAVLIQNRSPLYNYSQSTADVRERTFYGERESPRNAGAGTTLLIVVTQIPAGERSLRYKRIDADRKTSLRLSEELNH